MTTPQIEKEKDLMANKFEAEVREAEARLKVMSARADARKAKEEMDEISGLSATKERVKKDIADMKQKASTDFAATKSATEQKIKELQANIERVNERYAAWDDARDKRLNAHLDEAEARLKLWKAKADKGRADDAMKAHDTLATLKERIDLARARGAEATRDRANRKAQAALEESEYYFNQAYEAATNQYGKM